MGIKCIHGVRIFNTYERVADPKRFMTEGRCLECNPHVCKDTPWCHSNVKGHVCKPEDLKRNEASDRTVAHGQTCSVCRSGCPTCKRFYDEPQCAEGKELERRNRELQGWC